MGGAPDLRFNQSFIVQNSVEIGKPIIGVTITYRLSGWGFLDSEAVREEGSTNVGMFDQRFELSAVASVSCHQPLTFSGSHCIGFRRISKHSEEIRAKCKPIQLTKSTNTLTIRLSSTIWGESAGAASVGIHAIAFRGRDDSLFRGLISQSGSPIELGGKYNMSASEARYDSIIHLAGCSDAPDGLDCLRSSDYEILNAAINTTDTGSLPFAPYPDGDLIQGTGSQHLLDGSFVKVPYLIGTNSDEGSAFAMPGINSDIEFGLYTASLGFTGEAAAVVSAVYPDIPAIGIPELFTDLPGPTVGAQFKRVAALAGDQVFISGRRMTNQQFTRYNVTNYAYRFDTLPSGIPDLYGVAHFQEVAFVFDNTLGLGYEVNPFQGKPQSYYTLSKIMSCMWVSFIHDLDPNNHGQKDVPRWPVYVNGAGGAAISGNGGDGKDFVFHANGTGSYVESDTWRV
jgi:carboxylesterase type B